MYKLCIKIWGYVMEDKYVSVSQLTNYIKRKISLDPNLREVYVRGEISNYRNYTSSGHRYFSLKDENSIIPAVFFKWDALGLEFEPEDGMKVLVRGKVDVYPEQGKYQLYVKELIDAGKGNLHIAFEQLKKELKAEGYFDDSHKKPIPNFPEKVGVVTSPKGAAIRDIISTIKRRWPLCEIILFPSMVQGESAKYDIIKQIIKADKEFNLDTLIVGRGGGSIEDLWPFNEEKVARAIYDSNVPIISAVGHQIDYTISDFVADLRAPTPTAAAEMAVPDAYVLKSKLNDLNERITNTVRNKILENRNKLNTISKKNILKHPQSIYDHPRMNLELLIGRFENVSQQIIHDNRNKLLKLENSYIFKNPKSITKNKKDRYIKNISKLEVLNPLLTLKRGYAIAECNEKVISSSKDVKVGDKLDIKFDDGTINTKVI